VTVGVCDATFSCDRRNVWDRSGRRLWGGVSTLSASSSRTCSRPVHCTLLDVLTDTTTVASKRSIQRPKLTKPVCLTDFTCASYKITLKMYSLHVYIVETMCLATAYSSFVYTFNYIPPLIFSGCTCKNSQTHGFS